MYCNRIELFFGFLSPLVEEITKLFGEWIKMEGGGGGSLPSLHFGR